MIGVPKPDILETASIVNAVSACHSVFLEGLMQEHVHVGLVRQTLAVREALGGLQIPHRYADDDALRLRNAPQQASFLLTGRRS
jgi:hypothetical protein